MARPPRSLDPAASPRALFGSELRRYRDLAGLTQDQLGAKLFVSGSFVGAVERAEERCAREMAESADEVFGLHGAPLTHLWDGLMKASAYPAWFDWPKYEEQATTLRIFEPSAITGLLQTEDYARALLYGDDASVAARIARQRVLTREAPPMLNCILDETALHRRIGSAKVMHDQLRYLTEAVTQRIRVQILPNGITFPVVAGAFALATLGDGGEVAYVETAARGMTLGTREDVRTLTEAFDTIRSQALPVEMSTELIAKTAEEKWT